MNRDEEGAGTHAAPDTGGKDRENEAALVDWQPDAPERPDRDGDQEYIGEDIHYFRQEGYH